VRGVEAKARVNDTRGERSGLRLLVRGLWRPPGEGWVLSRLLPTHFEPDVVDSSCKLSLASWSLSPCTLASVQDCIAAQSAVRLPAPLLQDENPLLPASSKD
jgi:hypothetical protein